LFFEFFALARCSEKKKEKKKKKKKIRTCASVN